MESVENSLRIVYVIYTKVAYADEEFVRFAGSSERMLIGPKHPFRVGDSVKITFERIEDAQPKPTPIE